MRHPSFTWMVQQQYVARLAAVQQVSSGNPHQHLDGPAKEYSSSTCNNPAKARALTMVHGFDASLSLSLLGTTFFSQARMIFFSLGGAHCFSALLTCMSVREKGGKKWAERK
jgi:hypothetical protein